MSDNEVLIISKGTGMSEEFIRKMFLFANMYEYARVLGVYDGVSVIFVPPIETT